METPRLTDPTKPLRLDTVIVESAVDPLSTESEAWPAVMEKSGGNGFTVKRIVTTRDRDPLVPVTVTV